MAKKTIDDVGALVVVLAGVAVVVFVICVIAGAFG